MNVQHTRLVSVNFNLRIEIYQHTTYVSVARAHGDEAAGNGGERADLGGCSRVAQHRQKVRQYVLALSARVCYAQAYTIFKKK